MKKAGSPTYLSQDRESFMIESADIEDGHGLTLDSKGISDQLQCIIKSAKVWRGDININKNHLSSIATD